MIDLRKLARGKPCLVRLPGHCNHNRETTVLAHYRLSGYSGMGMKNDNWSFGAWCCAACHDAVDGRVKSEHDRMAIRLAHAEGVMRTQAEIKKLKAKGEL